MSENTMKNTENTVDRYVFFAGPGIIGPRAITALVALRDVEQPLSTREVAEKLGAGELHPCRRSGAMSSVDTALRKLRDIGFVDCSSEERTIEHQSTGTKQTRMLRVWTLTDEGSAEAAVLASAVRALKKSRTGLGLIRGLLE